MQIDLPRASHKAAPFPPFTQFTVDALRGGKIGELPNGRGRINSLHELVRLALVK